MIDAPHGPYSHANPNNEPITANNNNMLGNIEVLPVATANISDKGMLR